MFACKSERPVRRDSVSCLSKSLFYQGYKHKMLRIYTHMEVCSNIRHPEACMRETKYGNTRQDVLAVASVNCMAECINPSIILQSIYEYSMGVAFSLSSHLCICKYISCVPSKA